MDTLIRVDDKELSSLKLKKGNMHLINAKQYKKILKQIKNKTTINAGGSSSNTCAAIANLGGNAFFCGSLGKDELGYTYQTNMFDEGVYCNFTKTNIPTGNCITFITPDSERTFATYLGSALKIKKQDIPKSELLKSKILHIEGYILEDKNLRKTSLYAMNIAKENNIIISIDLSDSSLIKRNLSFFKKIIKDYANIVFVNEEEAKALAKLKDEYKALDKISEDVKLTIVKLGKKGSIMKIRGKTIRINPFTPKNLTDTTGAGDIYAAAILYGIANNISLEKSGKLASYASALVCNKIGARLDYSIRNKIKEITKLPL